MAWRERACEAEERLKKAVELKPRVEEMRKQLLGKE
jgi:hypothetical protein